MQPQMLLDFLNQYLSVPNVGDTPQNVGQCVGLIEKWIDILGLTHDWGNAKDLLNDANVDDFQVIHNTPDNFPVAGDIMVFDDSWGEGFGHTGVVLAANVNHFVLFEQNNPTGHAPTVITHDTYTINGKGVIGWLHPKKTNSLGGADSQITTDTTSSIPVSQVITTTEITTKQLNTPIYAEKKHIDYLFAFFSHIFSFPTNKTI